MEKNNRKEASPKPGKGGGDKPGWRRRRVFIRWIYNWVTFFGAFLIVSSMSFTLFFFILDIFSARSSGYIGVVYLFFLVSAIAGLVLIPVGMLLERRKQARGGTTILLKQWTIDFTVASHRHTVLAFLIGSVLVFLALSLGSYRLYRVTETNEFCGQVCHQAMNPEWVAHQSSSHARVKCVECHIGAGAEWYARSKVSGIFQIFSISTNFYSRPIPTPIHDLRPARETCEECHWPNKFIGHKEIVRTYYLADESNTPYSIRMLMKSGGEQAGLSGSNIHFHVQTSSKIEYIADDLKRQKISWVRSHRPDGRIVEFNNMENPLSEEEKSTLPVREMDCMDCHNRPAHKFPSPMDSVDLSIARGLIPRELPFIKREAARALEADYETTAEALEGIATHLRDFYREEYPALLQEKAEALRTSIAEVQALYRRTIFPEMKAKWLAYPENDGHRDWPGCFRCHNEEMRSAEDKTIPTTCNNCHIILAQGDGIDQVKEVDFSNGQPFLHPADQEPIEEYTECFDCHTGGTEVTE